MSKEDEMSQAVEFMKTYIGQGYTVKQVETRDGNGPMVLTHGWHDSQTEAGSVRNYLDTKYFQTTLPIVSYEQIAIDDTTLTLGLIHCNLPIHGNLFTPYTYILLKPQEEYGEAQILRVEDVLSTGPNDYNMTFAAPWIIKTKTLLGDDGPDLGRSNTEVSLDRVSFIVAVQ